jgi:tripartite-type tricarboxylate transporter receptor subunit TctC
MMLLIFTGDISRAQSQAFPSKPIKFIVTYPAGGSSDLLARILSRKLSEQFGQPLIIDNRTGAAGSIGMDYAAHQAADGYSFVIGNLGPALVNPLLSKLNYNMDQDFIALCLIATGPNVLVVNANSPYKNLEDLLKAAKSSPGALNFGSSGPGSMSHLSTEMLIGKTHIKLIHVPYKGGGLAVNDLLAGHIDFLISDALPVMQFIKSGQLRPLAVTSANRFATLPSAPSFTESGSLELVALNWWGIYLPAKTPKEIVSKYMSVFTKVMADEEVKSQFATLGVDAVMSSQQDFKTFIAQERNKYSKLIKDNNISIE